MIRLKSEWDNVVRSLRKTVEELSKSMDVEAIKEEEERRKKNLEEVRKRR